MKNFILTSGAVLLAWTIIRYQIAYCQITLSAFD